jgi:hypothetical protein
MKIGRRRNRDEIDLFIQKQLLPMIVNSEALRRMAARRSRNHLDVVQGAPCFRKELSKVAVTRESNSNRRLLHPLSIRSTTFKGMPGTMLRSRSFRGANQENPD